MAFDGMIKKRGQHVRERKHPGICGRRPDRKAQRVGEALARQEIRDERNALAQLRELDRRLGKDAGAVKERARLNARIEAAKQRAIPVIKEAVKKLVTPRELIVRSAEGRKR